VLIARRSSRALIAVALPSLLFLASAAAAETPPAPQQPAEVTVRVLGAAPTFPTLLALTQVTTTTAPVVKDGGSCSGTSAAGALELATKGSWEGKWNSGFGDYEVLSIEGQGYPFEAESKKNYYWSFWLDGKEANTGVCGARLVTGDQVLFFPGCFGSECPAPPNVLGVEAPTTGEVGSPVTVTVVSHPNAGGEPTPAAGAAVSSEGASGQTDASGRATLTFSHAGTYTLHVTAAGEAPPSVPAEAAICVHAGDDGTCGTQAPSPVASAAPAAGATPPAAGPDVVLARVTGLLDGHVYRRRFAPRLLRGTVDLHAALQDVELRLTRRRGRKCSFYDGSTGRFRTMRCGAAHGAFFSVGDHASFSYLLPAALGPGRYVLDVEATGVSGARSTLARGTSRIVFYVR